MFKFLSRKTVIKNQRFALHFDALVSEEGHQIPEYLVVEPNSFNDEGISGVAVLAIYEGKIALLKLHRHAVNSEVWEIPRGFVEGKESTVTAALRELEEETGLVTDRKNVRSLGTVLPEAGIMSAKIAIYLAENCKLGGKREAELGLKALEFVEIDKAIKMAQNSEIQDPCTIISLFRYKR